MRENVIITTTNSIDNAKVEQYLGLVSTNIVLGTNIFSDFSASVSDFFGGFSETYQNKLQIIYREATKELKQKAELLNANCVLGFKIDFDEISGKGKSMFMVSAIGTAVRIKHNHIDDLQIISKEAISPEYLDNQYKLRIITNKIKAKGLPSESEWNYLLMNNSSDIAPELTKMFIDTYYKDGGYILSSEEELLRTNFKRYISKVDKHVAIRILYFYLEQPLHEFLKKMFIDLIISNSLFDSVKITSLLEKDGLNIAFKLLLANKEVYTKDDISSLKDVLSTIDNLPNKGKHEFVKGLLSKGEEKYICPEGHNNSLDSEYCAKCHKNIKGITKDQSVIISAFSAKIDTLTDLCES